MRRPCTKLVAMLVAPFCALVAAFSAAGPAAASAAPVYHPGFLSEPAGGPAREVALSFLNRRAGDLGLAPADLQGAVVTDEVRSGHNGVTHLYLQQTLDGLEVVEGVLNLNVDRDGRVFGVGNHFVAGLAGAVQDRTPVLTPEEAIRAAAAHLHLALDGDPQLVDHIGGIARQAVFSGSGISRDDIPVKLVYQKTGDRSVRLAWRIVVRSTADDNWWDLRVDAVSGEALAQDNWTAYDTYRVFAFPAESPNVTGFGGRTDEVDPADPLASPFAWHDTNGAAGAEFTDTRGNNVFAQDDTDANNTGGSRPSGGPALEFLPAIDLATQEPADYLDAAVVNLFYWNNILHDIHYQYGFTEAAGNFQENNYGRGGIGGDPVQADAQDGSNVNNANFSTPPDGLDGRMQMFVWLGPVELTVNSPPVIAGDYAGMAANFGARFDLVGLTDDLALVDDGSPAPTQACNALVGFPAGSIAVIDRGGCEFGTKALNAENAGATGVVVVNNVGTNETITMGPGMVGNQVTIPAMMIGLADGNTIKAQLGGTVSSTLHSISANRDSDLDNGVIIHEYGHGVSNRLTGGPAMSGCLQGAQSGGMGEGWSDFWAIALTHQPDDTATTRRSVGSYVIFEDDPLTATGIRRFPYTTDTGVNPDTYVTIADTLNVTVPHGVGSVWTAMLWEVYWNLVTRQGFDPDLYGGNSGNNIALQLVMDGLKLQPCMPTFVNARDGILAADQMTFGGRYRCDIWRGFAKRGLGVAADDGVDHNDRNVTDDFTVPPDCLADLFSDGFESGDTSAWSNTVDPP
jgi:hypothetical protein